MKTGLFENKQDSALKIRLYQLFKAIHDHVTNRGQFKFRDVWYELDPKNAGRITFNKLETWLAENSQLPIPQSLLKFCFGTKSHFIKKDLFERTIV